LTNIRRLEFALLCADTREADIRVSQLHFGCPENGSREICFAAGEWIHSPHSLIRCTV